MTMIVGTLWENFGLLAHDSRMYVGRPRGPFSYQPADPAKVFAPFSSGFAGVAGEGRVGLAAIRRMADCPAGSLDDCVAWVRPTVEDMAALVGRAGSRDPHDARVAILTLGGSSGMGLGIVGGDGSVLRVPPGANVLIPPAQAPKEKLAEEFGHLRSTLEAFGVGSASAHDVLRALGYFYATAALLTPALSGRMQVGLIAHRSGGNFASLILAGRASRIADATDAELDSIARHLWTALPAPC